MKTFTVERGNDESGISGIGIVMEGVEFSDGSVVVRWNTDPGSTVHWASFADLKRICIDGHPTNNTCVRWSDGVVWWQNGPKGLQGIGQAIGYEVEAESLLADGEKRPKESTATAEYFKRLPPSHEGERNAKFL